MAKGIKIALPGYNATTDTNPDHFALYVDQLVDYILIKEKAKATVSVGASSNQTIAHGLGYIPFCLVFAEVSTGVWRKSFGRNIDDSGCYFQVNGTNLKLYNTTGSAKNFSYHIFYDQVA